MREMRGEMLPPPAWCGRERERRGNSMNKEMIKRKKLVSNTYVLTRVLHSPKCHVCILYRSCAKSFSVQ